MTKKFCDLCGDPAAEHLPTLRVTFPEMQWRGTKHDPGSLACVDGNWTPYVEGRMVFDAYDMPRSTRSHVPDLCCNCMASLLLKMSNSLAQPPLPTKLEKP